MEDVFFPSYIFHLPSYITNMSASEKKYLRIITAVSIIIPIAVAVLMYMPRKESQGMNNVSTLPLFHAILNGTTFLVLLTGYFFIRRKEIHKHRSCMLIAFALSSVFLISYIIYHYQTPPSYYGGEGIIRFVYFFVLLSHILLAGAIVPLALLALYRGITNQTEKHKKIAKWTLPLWLYVTFTGVVVYLMMAPYYPK